MVVTNPNRYWGKVDKNHAAYSDDQIEAVLEQALTHVDLDRDGYVDYHEYRYNMHKPQENTIARDKQCPQVAGPHPDIPVYEDQDLSEIVEGALKQADTNNDGYIDYAEFKSVTV
ncbi:uncharacterized protein LOC121736452 [Aricia agestis]|uniref:uncharacterized protein LOC121736452 n=1 Tax=Aricia agestis TaxID=91739 RepID=UPI001C2079B0|nr:uncharacterized protein LOC121736452 [Aricia agestis]